MIQRTVFTYRLLHRLVANAGYIAVSMKQKGIDSEDSVRRLLR